MGADAVAPLIEALRNAPGPVAKGSMWVLRRIGEPALWPLAEMISSESDPGALERASTTFSQLQVSSLDAYVPAFGHPSPKVRVPAVLLFRRYRQHALPYVPALAALLALAEAGGWATLSGRDQQLIQRLVRIKRAREVPEPVTWRGNWLAIPTEDQSAVLGALALSGARPVTMRLGISAWTHDQRHDFWHGEHQQCARAYVTPALNGWILVFGRLPELAHPGPLPAGNSYQDIQEAHPVYREALFRLCRELSERFGAAHWYGADCADLWTGWCLAERGKIVRHYDSEFPDDPAGPPHPPSPAIFSPTRAASLPEPSRASATTTPRRSMRATGS